MHFIVSLYGNILLTYVFIHVQLSRIFYLNVHTCIRIDNIILIYIHTYIHAFHLGTHLTPLTQDIDIIFPNPPIPDLLKPFVDLIPDAINPLKTRKASPRCNSYIHTCIYTYKRTHTYMKMY